MLQIILLLLGLVSSNPDTSSSTTNEDQTILTPSTQNTIDDTGGETSLPPKK